MKELLLNVLIIIYASVGVIGLILSDLLLRIVSGLYLGANALVLLLSIKLRRR